MPQRLLEKMSKGGISKRFESIIVFIFLSISQKSCTIAKVLLSTNNICFVWEIKEIIFNYALFILKPVRFWYLSHMRNVTFKTYMHCTPLKMGLSIHRRPYFVITSNEGSDDTVHLRGLVCAIAAHLCCKYQILLYAQADLINRWAHKFGG